MRTMSYVTWSQYKINAKKKKKKLKEKKSKHKTIFKRIIKILEKTK